MSEALWCPLNICIFDMNRSKGGLNNLLYICNGFVCGIGMFKALAKKKRW